MKNQEKAKEWAENPTTEDLFKLASKELQRINDTPPANCWVPGEPFKTQDNITELNARRYTWELFCEFLQGDWSYFEEEDDEQVRD